MEDTGLDLERIKEEVNSSAYQRLIGMRLTELSPGRCGVVLPVKEGLFHGGGVVHGGAIASLADTAMAVALIALVGHYRVLSIDLKINYVAPVREGELTAQGSIIHSGQRIALGEAEIKDGGGRLVAKGMGTYMVMP